MQLFSLASTKTNNFNDPEMATKIQQVWSKAMKNITEPTTIYGVYHDFDSDFKGDYRLSVATKNKMTDTSFTIDSQTNYQAFKVDTTQEMGVYQTWQKIWSLEEEGKLQRAYQFDYECYNENGTVTIYIECL